MSNKSTPEPVTVETDLQLVTSLTALMLHLKNMGEQEVGAAHYSQTALMIMRILMIICMIIHLIVYQHGRTGGKAHWVKVSPFFVSDIYKIIFFLKT